MLTFLRKTSSLLQILSWGFQAKTATALQVVMLCSHCFISSQVLLVQVKLPGGTHLSLQYGSKTKVKSNDKQFFLSTRFKLLSQNNWDASKLEDSTTCISDMHGCRYASTNAQCASTQVRTPKSTGQLAQQQHTASTGKHNKCEHSQIPLVNIYQQVITSIFIKLSDLKFE